MRIKITDSAESPLENVVVMVTESPYPVADIAAVTDKEGDAQLPAEDQGSYTLMIVHNEKKISRKVNITAPDQLLVIKI